MKYGKKTKEVQYKVTVKALEKQKDLYTITFDSMGGSDVESITAEANGAITKPTDPTKEGYVFGLV